MVVVAEVVAMIERKYSATVADKGTSLDLKLTTAVSMRSASGGSSAELGGVRH